MVPIWLYATYTLCAQVLNYAYDSVAELSEKENNIGSLTNIEWDHA